MSDRTIEKNLSGFRTEGNYHGHLDTRRGEEPELRKVKHFLQLDERCDGCPWLQTCAGDRTCWRQERVAELDVIAHRRKERLARLGLKDPRGAGLAEGIHVVLPEQPHDAAERLLETLGATFEVLPGAPAPGHLQTVDELGLEEGEPKDLVVVAESDSDRAPQPGLESPVSPPAGRAAEVASPSSSPRRRKPWTREAAIAAIQAWASEHGHPPTSGDAAGTRSLPSAPTVQKLGGWANLVEAAGFERPTRMTRYKNSSGPAAGSPPRVPDEQEPTAMGVVSAPPAEVAQLDPERRPMTPAGDVGSTPTLRFALIGVLDSLRVLVDALLPEEPM